MRYCFYQFNSFIQVFLAMLPLTLVQVQDRFANPLMQCDWSQATKLLARGARWHETKPGILILSAVDPDCPSPSAQESFPSKPLFPNRAAALVLTAQTAQLV
jgi:hypothetical protein